MIEEPAVMKLLPKLSFLDVEDTGEGMQVFEVKLDPEGTPLAPFKASRFTVEPNCSSPVDSHAVHEIWMVAEGEGELIYDNERISISASDIIYLEPPKKHLVRNDGTKPLVIFSIWWNGAATECSIW
jgi:quercetin dioxygenase-like cupin family protein